MTRNDLRHTVTAFVLTGIMLVQMVISYLLPDKYDWTLTMWIWLAFCWITAGALWRTIRKIGQDND